jgi:cellulose synthase/poly-beta-1,6-N-acetylglucosamine synthase-like glycosyltransferase
MASRPTVSIIVPAYNAEATLGDCVRSLLTQAQPISRLELIVVDNGSTDGTAAIHDRFSGAIRVVRAKKRGAAAARNAGLEIAHGDVVAFTDADCVADPQWASTVIAPLGDQAVGLVGGKILAKRPCGPIEAFGERIYDVETAIHVSTPPYVAGGNWASRRSVLRDVGGFDERFVWGHDNDLSYRIVRLGYRVVFQPDAVVYHQNERTLGGLFREGVRHGFWGIQVLKEHRHFLQQFGHRRFRGASYLALGSSLIDYCRGRNSTQSLCAFVFNLGKKTGKVLGSVKFRYVDL